LSVVVRRAWRHGTGGAVVPVMLASIAITTFIAGIARVDCSESSAACRALESANQVSGHHVLHQLISLPDFLCIALMPLFAAHRFRSDPDWRDLVRPSRWVSLVVALDIVALMAFETAPLMGLLQRVALTASYGWMIVLAWRLSPAASVNTTAS
jgi:hypothetical protein